MLDLNTVEFKSIEEIKRSTPSIFTPSGAPTVSDKYTHISTERVINDMDLLGWKVVDTKEVKTRKKENSGFQKHLIVFRNPEVVINGENGDDVYPQILLTNSHDGKNSFTFTAGLFRMVCENGLVVSKTEFDSLRIRHMGYDFETLQGVIKDMVTKLPLTVESINKMTSTTLSENNILKFANDCLNVRHKVTKDDPIIFNVKDMLTPKRKADEGDSLWAVFNVIQEKIMDGDYEYQNRGKLRKARPIKNFKQDMDINAKLFDIALNYAD